MKNIYEILSAQGIEIPDDKKEAINKEVSENYKTINEVEGIKSKLTKAEAERDTYKTKYDTDISTRDNDLATLQKQLADAGVDKTKLDELTTQLATLQTTYETAKTDYEKQLLAQKYEFLVKDNVNALKFTSNSAKKAFISEVMQKNLPVQDDRLLGFEDFVNAYKEQDAGAFITEDAPADNETGKPHFSGKSNPISQEEQKPQNDVPSLW